MTPNYLFLHIFTWRDNLQQNTRSQATYYCQKPETDSVFLIKMVHFGCFFQVFRGPGAHILSQVAQNGFFLFLMIQVEKNRAKSYVTCPVFTQYHRLCMHCRKSTSRGPFWPIFVRRSKFFIPRFINIYIFELFTSF